MINLFLILISISAKAAEPAKELTFGGFIDTYFAYDFNTPANLDRSFTTQPARHNEFNINLAFIEAKLEKEKIHGRLALQGGTSVLANYAAEPILGNYSGLNLLARNFQEAYAGYRLGTDTWVDAGIMLSHIGAESFISRDNLTYTRSLVADNSPYYQAGVRLSSKLSDKLSAQVLVLNGWQIISESNDTKALGTQLVYTFNPEFSITYNTFVGREYAFRHFHDVILKWTPNEDWSLIGQADIGFQADAPGGRDAMWNGFTLMAKRAINKTWSVVGRAERYTDPKQVIIAASNGSSFQAWSGSLGIDANLDSQFFWRNEVRGYFADNAIFSSPSGFKTTDAVLVSSVSVLF